ncbi:MAG: hypothetical protein P4L10_17500 [Acidobacteriaceae bacterium]|nr:hypothetical protein [Acidobacteriaceae bacterium]
MMPLRTIMLLLALAFPLAIHALSFRLEYNKPFCFVEDRPAESVTSLSPCL